MMFAAKRAKAEPPAATLTRPTSPVQPESAAPSRDAGRRAAPSFSFGDLDLRGSTGEPMSSAHQRRGRRVFGGELEDVRVHSDAPAATAAARLSARAFTIGPDIYFGTNQWRPSEPTGMALLGHELAHVIQQRQSSMQADARAEGEATRAGVAFTLGLRAPAAGQAARGSASAPMLQCSPLSDQVNAAWTAAPIKGRIFDLLRAAAQPDAARDTDLRDVLQRIFAGQPDDLWLAETIRQHGPEPLWPATALDERGRRAQANSWAAEPGNIAASFAVPGRLPVRAFYFRGQTDRRAMVIAGVHGSEVSGVEVVERLMTRLTSPGAPMPYYTLIVVPRLFPERVAAELATTRRPGSNSNEFRESGEMHGGREIPTNRNFPRPPPGSTPAQARSAAAAATTDAQATPQPILAQNRILLGLIDRFRPERIATVHGNRRAAGMRRGGPGSGVFVDPAHPSRTTTAADPRVEDANADRDHPRTAEDRLTANMARLIVQRGGRAGGNFVDRSGGTNWQDRPVGQTRYDPAHTLHNDGVSLGTLGPSIGATVITVEVPWYEGTASYAAGTAREGRRRELEAYAASLEEVFLGPADEAASAP
jgi:hypothetical protein